MRIPYRETGPRSFMVSVLGVLMFSISLFLLITLDLNRVPIWVIPLGMVWQTLLYTGLFITVHDSMHGSILPKHRFLNDLIGTVSVFFYAMFSYRKLKKKHFEHHKAPGTDKDPDFHDGTNEGFFHWYSRFLKNYMSPFQLLGISILFFVLVLVVGLPWQNLVLFWAIPSISSTFQLFYFGTYLPHREPDGGYTNKHHATSSGYPFVISLVTCYHFGYHLEHHMYPYVPWWKLPWVRKDLLRKGVY